MNNIESIDISLIDYNQGQISGVPANPRNITDEKFETLKANIVKYPEMLEYRGLLVYPSDGRYVTIGGNMRLKALRDVGEKTAPCVVIPQGTDPDRLRAYAILDNNEFGEWVWADLKESWNEVELGSWGIDLPKSPSEKMTALLSTLKYDSPYYEPSRIDGLKLNWCIDTTLYDKKVQYINDSDLPEDKKALMRVLAQRFIKIDFEGIANYYTYHATDVERDVLERLRVVLVDDGSVAGFVEDGLIKINDALNETIDIDSSDVD